MVMVADIWGGAIADCILVGHAVAIAAGVETPLGPPQLAALCFSCREGGVSDPAIQNASDSASQLAPGRVHLIEQVLVAESIIEGIKARACAGV